jgi:hypothetical protein
MYRHYTTGQKLMTLLVERFTLPPPAGNVLAQEEWKQRVQTPIRLRYSRACGCACVLRSVSCAQSYHRCPER